MDLSIYISGEPLDLFGDESITIVKTLRDFKALDAVVGDYTFSFSIPATGNNNRIFKHFYDVDIFGGFSGHQGIKTQIVAHNLVELSGIIELLSVEMKERNPNAYKIAFYGSTNSLKEVMGEALMSELELSFFDHTPSSSNIQLSWGLALNGGSIYYPIIAFDRNFLIAQNPQNTNNVNAINNTAYKVRPEELNPAYRIKDLLVQVFAEFDKTLTGDFLTDEKQNTLFTLPMQSEGYAQDWIAKNKFYSEWRAGNATLFLAATNTKIDFTSATYDPNSQIDTAADTFTAGLSGSFEIILDAQVSVNAFSKIRVKVKVNGSFIGAYFQLQLSTLSTKIHVVLTVPLIAGDVVELYWMKSLNTDANITLESPTLKVTAITGS